MRNFIDIVSDTILNESSVIKIEGDDGESMRVYKNPSKSLLPKLLSQYGHLPILRGIISKSNDLYVWPAYDNIHSEVDMHLAWIGKCYLIIEAGKVMIGTYKGGNIEEVRNNHMIRRAMGNTFEVTIGDADGNW